MRLQNIIGNTQPQPRTLRSMLRRKKRLQNFVFDLIRNARAVVFDFDGYSSFGLMSSNFEFRFITPCTLYRALSLDSKASITKFKITRVYSTLNSCTIPSPEW